MEVPATGTQGGELRRRDERTTGTGRGTQRTVERLLTDAPAEVALRPTAK